MSEFKGRIVVGTSIAIIAALGLAVAFVAFTPSTFQSTTDASLTGASTSTTSVAQQTISSSSSSSVSNASTFYSTIASTEGANNGNTNLIIPRGAGSPENLSLNFEPSQMTVIVGLNNTITVTNEDNQSHWFVFTSLPVGVNQSQFANTPRLSPGQNFTFTLIVPGVYDFEDAWHPVWLHGSITVLGTAISSSSTTTSTCTSAATSLTLCYTTSTTCTISGEPDGFYLSVVSDSGQTPIVGATVMATNEPAYCNSTPANNRSTLTFVTNGTEWYSLGSQNNAGYSISVSYSGQTYNFTADLRPVSETCATLYLPSGRTNVTMAEFQTSCPSVTEQSSSTSSVTTYNASCTDLTTTSTNSDGSASVTSSESCVQQIGPLTWQTNYGVWNYAVTLSADNIQHGTNITATFTLTNLSNQTQTTDIVDPLVNPTIYSQNGQQVFWMWNPTGYNQIENVTAGQSVTLSMVLPTAKLVGGQSYTLSSYPGLGTPGFAVNVGPHLQLNETITVS